MKKTIVSLLTVATMIGCLAAPAAAASVKFKIYNKWMDTFYYNSYMADRGYVNFKRSPAISNPGDYKTTVIMDVWLVGKDGKKRGDRTMRTYICVNTCGTSTSPVDHDFKNTPDGSCTFIKQEPNN